jgi:hypothetical protein
MNYAIPNTLWTDLYAEGMESAREWIALQQRVAERLVESQQAVLRDCAAAQVEHFQRTAGLTEVKDLLESQTDLATRQGATLMSSVKRSGEILDSARQESTALVEKAVALGGKGVRRFTSEATTA